MLYQTKETLVRPDWMSVLLFSFATALCVLSYATGFVAHDCEPCECQECVVGFAALEDMMSLSDELEACKKWGVP